MNENSVWWLSHWLQLYVAVDLGYLQMGRLMHIICVGIKIVSIRVKPQEPVD